MPSKAALEIREEYKRWDGYPKPLRTFQDWYVDADALCEEVARLRQIEGCATMMAALMAEDLDKFDMDVFLAHQRAFVTLLLGPDPQATMAAAQAGAVAEAQARATAAPGAGARDTTTQGDA